MASASVSNLPEAIALFNSLHRLGQAEAERYFDQILSGQLRRAPRDWSVGRLTRPLVFILRQPDPKSSP